MNNSKIILKASNNLTSIERERGRGTAGKSSISSSPLHRYLLCGLLPLAVIFIGISHFHVSTNNTRANGETSGGSHVNNLLASSKAAFKEDIITKNGKNNYNKESSNVNYHIVFSTACSPQQNWQSYALFYHAFKIKQPGHITRIVSGCTSKNDVMKLAKFHFTSIASMSNKFKVHFTPDYSRIRMAGGKFPYKYMNKPFGLRHWMEHGLLRNKENISSTIEQESGDKNFTSIITSINEKQGQPESSWDDIVILMDPDMILLRPIHHNFSNEEHVIWGDNRKPSLHNKTWVRHGNPIAQRDGYLDNQWLALNMTTITNDTNSYIVTQQGSIRINPEKIATRFYNSGPPYLATVKDMYNLSLKWTEFAPRVYDQYPKLFAEMYGYVASSAHLRLPHELVDSIVISDPNLKNREGWQLIDQLPDNEVCSPVDPSSSAKLPIIIHYCQRLFLGPWFFSKYRLRKDFFSCEVPLLAEPPDDIAKQYNYSLKPPKASCGNKWCPPEEQVYYDNKQTIKREAFMLCHLINAINEAAIYYKRHNCAEVEPNFNKSYNFFDPPYF